MKKELFILAIESSCDDTSAAVLKDKMVLANVMASQRIHADYGGVVPELASRQHQRSIWPVVDHALKVANLEPKDLDAIAFTAGPGLLGSLLVGGSFARGLAIALKKPYVAVNHMKAHILAHFIEGVHNNPPQFPFLCLTVSGGHTQLIKVQSYFNFQVLGETIDDAAGEAFDKLAKMLGLSYPGGPEIEKISLNGNANAFEFAKPQIPEYNFSFRGLKTSFLYKLQKEKENNPHFLKENIADFAASAQKSIVDTLMKKLDYTIRKTGINQIAIAGGVSANSRLRYALAKKQEEEGWEVFIPPILYCTDNAAMVGVSAYFQLVKDGENSFDLPIKARWAIND